MASRRRSPFRLWLPAVLSGTVAVGFFYRSVLSAGRFPGIHDLVFFHLPLRAEFARLARSGLPLWNSTIHGGQPILSNPNYGAFYPPSWLFLLFDPIAALELLVLLHAAWGFAGAWRLARHLGCSSSAAVLASVGFVGGGAMVSSVGTLSPFFSLAWFPWIMLWGSRALVAVRGERALSAALAAVGLALQLVAGEPTVAFLTAGALLAVGGLDRTRRLKKSALVIGIVIAGAGVAAIQLLPTLDQVSESSRTGEPGRETNLIWSTPPERLAELVAPRVHGEPTLAPRGLYFGAGVHDKTYPYLLSIYPGQILLALALTGLLVSSVRRRTAWGVMLAAGLLLALGRHNPVYAGFLVDLPPFRWIRYPEKFLLLATSVIPFVAALTWSRLLEERASGERRVLRPALAVAFLLVAANLCMAGLLALFPNAVADFVQTRTPELRSAEELAASAAFLGRGALVQLGLAVLFLLALAFLRRPEFRRVAVALPLLAAFDLGLANRWLNPTVSVESFTSPPPWAREMVERGERIATDQGFFLDKRARPLTAAGDESAPWIGQRAERLEPFVGSLWGLSYALNPDYDLMATQWAESALEQFYVTAAESQNHLAALLGAWSIDTFVVGRPGGEVGEYRSADPRPPPVQMLGVGGSLAPARFVPETVFFASLEAARADVVARAFKVDTLESLFVPNSPVSRESFDETAVVHRLSTRSDGAEIEYQAAAEALLVLATTYHEGWRASTGGETVPVYATALGQTAIRLPPGKGTVLLRFRQPWLAAGAVVSASTLLLLLLVVSGAERRKRTASGAEVGRPQEGRRDSAPPPGKEVHGE